MEWEDRGAMAAAIRKHLYVPDGQPPPRWDMGRCLSVVKTMKRYGEDEREIRDAMRGLALMREQGMLGGFLRPGEKATMRVFITAKSHGIPLYRRALHEVRKRESHESEAAMTAIGRAMDAAAGRG